MHAYGALFMLRLLAMEGRAGQGAGDGPRVVVEEVDHQQQR